MDYSLESVNDVIDENNFFKAIVFNDDGSFSKMDEKEKNKYIDWFNRCGFIQENGTIVQLNLKKYKKIEKKKKQLIENYFVDFNGMASYNDTYGGFCFYGVINLANRSIDTMVSWDNTDKYEQLKTIYTYHLWKNEGKVK